MKPQHFVITGAVAVVGLAAVMLVLTLVGGDDPEPAGDSTTARQEATLTGPRGGDQQAQQPREALPELPWQTDDPSVLTQPAAESLSAIDGAAPDAALILANSGWLSDPDLHLEEQQALARIEEIAEEDPALARLVVTQPWMRGQVTSEGLYALDQVSALARVQPELAADLASAEWARDGITLAEQMTFALVRDVAEEDPAQARRIAEAPQVQDGISSEELSALTGSDNYWLERLEREHPQVAETVKSYAWLSDGLSLAPSPGHRPPGLASPLRQTPLTDLEMALLAYIRVIAVVNQGLAERVAALPWLADDMTEDELAAVGRMHFLNNYRTELVELLLDQPWVQDEFTEEDAALIITLRACMIWEDQCAQHIIQGRVETRTLSFPTGDVKAMVVTISRPGAQAAVASSQAVDYVVEHVRLSIEALQEFMGAPWGSPRVIAYQNLMTVRVYLQPARMVRYGDVSNGEGFIAMYGIVDTHTYFHEMAHFYATSGPGWLTEGGAEFLTRYTCQFAGRYCWDNVISMADRYDQLTRGNCPGCYQYATVRDMLRDWAGRYDSFYYSWYGVGERFLHSMYVEFDEDITRETLRDLWRWDRRPPRITEEDVYLAFLDNTPPERHDEFKDHYRRLHGGPPEVEVLEALYHATNGPNWSDNENWLSDAPLGSWEGVSTDANGRVASLRLNSAGLQGPIPPELGNLSNLVILDLSRNTLTGPIPPELGNLDRLEHLSLANNQLSGQIPVELANLVRLREISLSGNALTGCVPVRLPEIMDPDEFTRLGLPACEEGRRVVPLAGSVEGDRAALEALYHATNGPHWSSDSSVYETWLSDFPLRQWKGVRTDSDGRVTKVEVYGLQGQLPAELGNLSRLETLVLDDIVLTGPLPPELGNISSLRHLELWSRRQQMSVATIPPWLGNLPNLSSLHLRGLLLTGPIPPELGNLTHLRDLRLDDNRLSGEIPPELGNLAFLAELYLSQNQLTGQLPVEWGNPATHDRWRRIYLSENDFTGCLTSHLLEAEYNDFDRLGLPACE